MSYALPRVAINNLSPETTGYFYMSWTLMNFVLLIPRAVASSMFVEGVHGSGNLQRIAARSLLLMIGLVLPIMFSLWFLGHWVLSLFGKAYINTPLLRLLLISVIPFCFNSVLFMSLRVQKRLLKAVVLSGVIAAATIILASLLTTRLGLLGIAWGWLLGHTIPALCVMGILGSRLLARNAR